MNQPDSEILTLDEVAVYLKAGKKTVYRLAQQGEIPGFKLGGTWRFRRSELDRWIAAQIPDTRLRIKQHDYDRPRLCDVHGRGMGAGDPLFHSPSHMG